MRWVDVKAMLDDGWVDAQHFIRLQGKYVTVFPKEMNKTLPALVGSITLNLSHRRSIIVY